MGYLAGILDDHGAPNWGWGAHLISTVCVVESLLQVNGDKMVKVQVLVVKRKTRWRTENQLSQVVLTWHPCVPHPQYIN